MARVRLSQPRSDQLVIEIGRAWLRAALLLVLALAWAGLWLEAGDGAAGWALWLVGLGAVPALGVGAFRALRAQRRSLVRSAGRLVLDGDMLELARVELRVLQLPLTHTPSGYALSRWVMSSSGPEDLPLGRFRTLLDASRFSGQLEDFVGRANARQPGRTGV